MTNAARRSTLRDRLATGGPLVGISVQLPDAGLIEASGLFGFAFVLIDGEHGPLDDRVVQDLARAADVAGMATIVRIPTVEPGLVGRYLDTGVDGILAPHIATADDARRLVGASRYPPRGDRSIGRSRALAYGIGPSLLQAARLRDSETVVAALVEDAEGLANIEAIAAVDGLDAIFLGPMDLAASMGYPELLGEDELEALVASAIGRIVAAGRYAGVAAGAPAVGGRRLAQGATLVFANVFELLGRGASDYLAIGQPA